MWTCRRSPERFCRPSTTPPTTTTVVGPVIRVCGRYLFSLPCLGRPRRPRRGPPGSVSPARSACSWGALYPLTGCGLLRVGPLRSHVRVISAGEASMCTRPRSRLGQVSTFRLCECSCRGSIQTLRRRCALCPSQKFTLVVAEVSSVIQPLSRLSSTLLQKNFVYVIMLPEKSVKLTEKVSFFTFTQSLT